MLINTVILFIKDLLPVCILLCFVGTCIAPQLVKIKYSAILVGLVGFGVLTTYSYLLPISELFEGSGLEVAQASEIIIVYAGLLICSYCFISGRQLNLIQKAIVLISIAIYCVINLNEFFLFLTNYLTNQLATKYIIAGIFLGLGICLSFSALFALTLLWLVKSKLNKTLHIIWALYLAGLISDILNTLQQVDWIVTGTPLWNSEKWVSSSSEYGYLLKALFGYTTVPTVEFIMIYLGSLIIYLVYFLSLSSKKFTAFTKPDLGE